MPSRASARSAGRREAACPECRGGSRQRVGPTLPCPEPVAGAPRPGRAPPGDPGGHMEDRAMRSPIHRRRPARSTLVFPALIALAALAVACGSGSGPFGGATGGRAAPSAAPAFGGAPGPKNPGTGDEQSAASAGPGQPGGNDQLAVVDDTKIVRTGSVQMTVADVTQALAKGRDAIRSFGGYIGESDQERSGDTLVATITYRIPVDRWEDALAAIRGLGTEIGEKTNAVEVTGDIVDLQARIRSLRASETALVGYAEHAPKVSDLLEIQARLTDTRGQIERLTGQEAQLQDQAAMATLTVTFGTEAVAVTEAAARWDPAAEVDRATATLLGMGQALVSFAIVFTIVWLPLLLAIALVATIGYLVARPLRGRRAQPIAPIPPA